MYVNILYCMKFILHLFKNRTGLHNLVTACIRNNYLSINLYETNLIMKTLK